MNRRELLRLLGLGLALPTGSGILAGCGDETGGLHWDLEVNFSGKVLIIGAGAAGLAAGYLLERYGIAFEILEAAPSFGGRVRRLEDFADFPIDLGAEWIHEDPRVLAELIDDPSVEASIEVIPYSPDSIANYDGGRLKSFNFGTSFYGEYKFKDTTWYGFLAEHIAKGIESRIVYDCPVVEIDSSGEGVRVRDAKGVEHLADRVVVTVPIPVLQDGDIEFVPPWPADKLAALAAFEMPDGIKVFIEFEERFYPDITLVGGGPLSAAGQSQIYYDAAFRKDSTRNILGLFCVGESATQYTNAGSDAALIELILAKLDTMFEGQASPSYRRHVAHNWSTSPYVRGSYAGVASEVSKEAEFLAKMREPLDDKVYFAGEALSDDNASTVPGAMQTGYAAIRVLLAQST